jgi:hypothetical protein
MSLKKLSQENLYLQEVISANYEEFIGISSAAKRIFQYIDQVADYSMWKLVSIWPIAIIRAIKR